ncbi:MAG: hypothetical protein CSB22_00440 [Deltaproteobacteria bacterium]|nr:MAG: hypothetical protein CSB22_00440 [Deltaproteobacteria bacterium]
MAPSPTNSTTIITAHLAHVATRTRVLFTKTGLNVRNKYPPLQTGDLFPAHERLPLSPTRPA